MLFDAVVVGGGPAGSTAARILAAAGARVALVEKAHYPRAKPCAGGVTPRARRLLAPVVGPDWSGLVAAEVHSVVVLRRGRTSTRYAPQVCLWETVSRQALDARLAERAGAAGATVRCGLQVTGVRWERDRWLVCHNSGHLQARAVIGADGASSGVKRSLGLRPYVRSAGALELDLPLAAGDRRFENEAWIDCGAAPRGYAWLFPRGGRVSVGVCGLAGGPELHRALSTFLCALKLPLTGEPSGWLIPVPYPCGPASTGSALLVGDAAGLVDPFTGEGLYFAARSGELAATALLGSDFGPLAGFAYESSLSRTLRVDLRWGDLLARLIHTMLDMPLASRMAFPEAFEHIRAVAEGRAGYKGLLRRWLRWRRLGSTRESVPRL